jgi:hypothetical protein
MINQNNFTIVTGTSSNHLDCLLNLLYSLKVFAVKAEILVYDLGLSQSEREMINKFPVNLIRFEYENYPDYLKIINTKNETKPKEITCGYYAWKPVIIDNVLQHYKGIVLWMDAGNLVYSNLDILKKIIEVNGIYSPFSSDKVAAWTHPDTLALLKVSEDILLAENRNAAVVGFNADYPGIMELSEKWKDLALTKECIAPPGSSLFNHRYDQAILTILMYQFQKKYNYKFVDRLIDFDVHMDDLVLLGENKEEKLLEYLLSRTRFLISKSIFK